MQVVEICIVHFFSFLDLCVNHVFAYSQLLYFHINQIKWRYTVKHEVFSNIA